MLTGTDARLDEVVGEAVRRGVEFGVGEAALLTRARVIDVHQSLAVRDHVDHRFEQVGKVVLHRSS